MPILDTVVLFGAADSRDRHHARSAHHLATVDQSAVYLGGFAIFEFDVTLKSRGLSFEERMGTYALLLRDYPALASKVASISPATFYLGSRLEAETALEYFDAGVAAEALQHDGTVVSTDRAFDRVQGLTRTW